MTVTLEISEAELTKFNKRYDKSYTMYSGAKLESPTVTIKKGSASSPARLMVEPLSEERIATGDIYAVPVTIKSVDGAGILQGSETFIYVIKGTPRATTLVFNKGTAAEARHLFMPMSIFDNNSSYTFTAYTFEFLIKIKEFTKANNYDLINPTVGALAGEIYTRIEGGSNGLNKAMFNVKFNGDNESIAAGPSGGLLLDKWYHVAFVFGNGKLKALVNGSEISSMDVTLPSLVLGANPANPRPKGPEGFTWGAGAANSGYGSNASSRNTIESAELRIWNVARTAEQIKEYMYSVRPDSEGLLGYWKLNGAQPDGTIKDETGKNPNAYMIKFKMAENNGDSSNLGWDKGFVWNESNQELTVSK